MKKLNLTAKTPKVDLKTEVGGIVRFATLKVGETTTLPAGDSVSVSNSGTNTDAVLNFAIPQGAPGIGIHYQGEIGEYSELPSVAEDGDAYYLEGRLYIYTKGHFPDLGKGILFQGEKGEPGDDGFVDAYTKQEINAQAEHYAKQDDNAIIFPDGSKMWIGDRE